MGFNSIDTAALSRAADHFVISPQAHVNTSHHVAKIEVKKLAGFPDDADVLYGAIQALDRFFGDGDNTTVWLAVDASLPNVPKYVAPALSKLGAYGVGLVITHGTACSHDHTLKGDFIEPLKAALRDGQVFHPIRGKLADASI